jgi:hypothetical protein
MKARRALVPADGRRGAGDCPRLTVRDCPRYFAELRRSLDQARRLRRRGPGASAAAQPPKARAARAGPQPNATTDLVGSFVTSTGSVQPSSPLPIIQLAVRVSKVGGADLWPGTIHKIRGDSGKG